MLQKGCYSTGWQHTSQKIMIIILVVLMLSNAFVRPHRVFVQFWAICAILGYKKDRDDLKMCIGRGAKICVPVWYVEVVNKWEMVNGRHLYSLWYDIMIWDREIDTNKEMSDWLYFKIHIRDQQSEQQVEQSRIGGS